MSTHTIDKPLFRIIDANTNRAKEGLRVCEEITRFMLNSPSLTRGLKDIRHRLDGLVAQVCGSKDRLRERNSLHDVGSGIAGDELRRKDMRDIFFANIQRVKESIRVLEEFSKLKNIKAARVFKTIRYRLYEIEKKSYRALEATKCA